MQYAFDNLMCVFRGPIITANNQNPTHHVSTPDCFGEFNKSHILTHTHTHTGNACMPTARQCTCSYFWFMVKPLFIYGYVMFFNAQFHTTDNTIILVRVEGIAFICLIDMESHQKHLFYAKHETIGFCIAQQKYKTQNCLHQSHKSMQIIIIGG